MKVLEYNEILVAIINDQIPSLHYARYSVINLRDCCKFTTNFTAL